MTWFTLTAVHSPAVMVLFANGRFYGAAPYSAEQLERRNVEAFTRIVRAKERNARA